MSYGFDIWSANLALDVLKARQALHSIHYTTDKGGLQLDHTLLGGLCLSLYLGGFLMGN